MKIFANSFKYFMVMNLAWLICSILVSTKAKDSQSVNDHQDGIELKQNRLFPTNGAAIIYIQPLAQYLS